MRSPSWLCLTLALVANASLHAQTLRFTDISASAGIRGIVEHGGHAIVFADVNADGFADMYVTHTNFAPGSATEFLVLPDELFINNGDNTFTNAAASAGVEDPGQSHGAALVDIDNDGDFDLFNGQRGPHGNRLYRNAGNATFTETTSAAGILASDRRTIGVLGLDIENDGDVDLFAANWGLGNELYVNDGAGGFSNQTHRGVFDREPDNAGTVAATAADVDNDGDLDIFLAKRNDTCRLYVNNGNGFFVDEANARGAAFNGIANGGVFFDMDRDADLDLLLAASTPNGSRNGELTVLRVYRNNGNGFFVDETNAHNIPFEGYTVNVGDLDNDGDEDIFLAINFGQSSLWLNDGAGRFTKQSNTGLERNGMDARATSFSDVDNDGDLDVALAYIEEPSFLFRNDLNTNRNAKNFLQVGATSPSGEAGAWGAKFYLYEAGRLDDAAFLRGYRQLASAQGTLSGNAPLAHFGVDPSLTYDLRVRYLGGATAVLTNLAPGQRIHVHASDNAPPAIGNVAAVSLAPTSATITWNTDEPATSQVEYGATPALGTFTNPDEVFKQTHRVVLNNLLSGATYYYRVLSRDAANQASASDTLAFLAARPDSTPPLIGNINALGAQASSVRLVWSTDEIATSQVEYGLTPSYGALSPEDSTLTTTHEIRLAGLNSNATYHFRVISQDAQGNRAVSGDAQFTTLAAPLLADDFNAASLDLTKWTKGSHSGNTSTLVNGALILRTTTPSTSGWIHTRDKFTGANKSAQIKVVQANDDGALGLSPTVTTSALNGIYHEPNWYRFYCYRTTLSGPYKLFVQWQRNGVVHGLDVAANTAFFAPFYLRLRTDATNIFFEYSFDNSAWQTAYGEAFALPGHSLHEQFHFELAAFNTPVKGEWGLDDFTLSATVPLIDNLAPVISAVSASNITSTSANIVWSTDEAGDAQVEYGVTSGYGALTALDPALVRAHSQTLVNLAPNALYHYRAHSRDASGNRATSADFTFTTAATGPLFVDDFNATTLDLTKWTRGANSGNQTAVRNNALQLQASGAQSGWVVTRQAYVARNTSVAVKIAQPNDDGDLGMSPTFNAASSNGIYGEENWYRFYVYREAPGNYRLFAQWAKGGVESGLDVTGALVITPQSGVYLRLRFDEGNIRFEASLDGAQWSAVYSEAFSLPGYSLADKFYYELAAARTETKGVMLADDFTIQSETPIIDTQAPVLSNVASSNLTATGAAISWNTDEPSDAQVEYGFTASYGALSPLAAALSTSHRLALAGLSSDTTYHYRVRSQDPSGNLALSADFTFRTLRANTSVLFADDFSGNALDASKWSLGANSGNRATASNNALRLQSLGSQSGWALTKQAYVAKNSAVTVRVTQPNDDGDLGMSPTFDLNAATGIYAQKNWYRFYVYRDQPSGPYLLYAQWSKNGAVVGRDVTSGIVITAQSGVYLRLRFDATQIYFEASLDGASWTTAYREAFALPGYSLDGAFYYELSAYKTQNKNALIVDDFAVTTTASAALANLASEENAGDALPESFALSPNYPNPFNLATHVRLSLPEPGRVQAVIYNMPGQEVRRLYEASFSAGTHVLHWRGVNDSEESVSSGMYLLRVIFESASGARETVTRRLVVMK